MKDTEGPRHALVLGQRVFDESEPVRPVLIENPKKLVLPRPEQVHPLIDWYAQAQQLGSAIGYTNMGDMVWMASILTTAYRYGADKAREMQAVTEPEPPKPKPRPKPKKTTPQARAARGRRDVLEGKRPAIKDAIKLIMGSKTMTADEVMEGLTNPPAEARKAFEKTNPKADPKSDWIPDSNKPRAYVAYLLSSEKDHFIAGPRGHYRVRRAGTSSPKKQKKQAGTLKDRIFAILTKKKALRDDHIAKRLKSKTHRVNEALKEVRGVRESRISGHRAWRLV